MSFIPSDSLSGKISLYCLKQCNPIFFAKPSLKQMQTPTRNVLLIPSSRVTLLPKDFVNELFRYYVYHFFSVNIHYVLQNNLKVWVRFITTVALSVACLLPCCSSLIDVRKLVFVFAFTSTDVEQNLRHTCISGSFFYFFGVSALLRWTFAVLT